MSGARTNTGCWTCRVRKKKCTEERPACAKCDSLQITCHGYGNKPKWMDGSHAEQAEAERIKRAVKESNKRKRQLEPIGRTMKRPSGARLTTAAPRSSRTADPLALTKSPLIESTHDDTVIGEKTSYDVSAISRPTTIIYQKRLSPGLHTNEMGTIQPLRTEDIVPLSDPPEHLCRNCGSAMPLYGFNGHEATLLMHYLDHVFQLQFRFYNPLVHEGGRGWLLSILMRTKPLFHAALSLSAYHQISWLPSYAKMESNSSILEDQERHHSLTLVELRHHIECLSLASGARRMTTRVEILACMVQLISFEVFRGGHNDWQTHLQAARLLFMDIKDCFTMPLRPFESRIAMTTMWAGNSDDSTSLSSLSSDELLALDFFASALVWFDILSSATTGWKPNYPNVFSSLLRIEDGRIQLCKLMGCKNWVMVAIMDIAVLAEWKTSCQKCSNLSLRELSYRAAAIEQQLKVGIIQNEQLPLSYIGACGVRTLESQAVTHVFACSAQIYLHVVQSGPYPEIAEIKESVIQVIKAFRNLPDGRWVRHLVWPFCIAGCMAGEEHVDDFRQIALAANTDGEIFRNFEKASAIMEECWKSRKRDAHGPWSWTTAMESLGVKVLLI